MELPVRIRTHWGIWRFCFIFLERIFLILKVLWEGWGRNSASMVRQQQRERRQVLGAGVRDERGLCVICFPPFDPRIVAPAAHHALASPTLTQRQLSAFGRREPLPRSPKKTLQRLLYTTADPCASAHHVPSRSVCLNAVRAPKQQENPAPPSISPKGGLWATCE